MNGEESFFEDMFIVDTVLESADGGERRDNQKCSRDNEQAYWPSVACFIW